MKIAEYNEMMAYLLRPAQEAKLVDDLEPGSLKDELLKDFDPSQETYEEYLRRKSMRETAAHRWTNWIL
jgi:cell division FtsZ-interacting protein ZapD